MTNNQTQNKKLSTDSKTSDVSSISVHDSRLTVRINSKLKEAFLKHCKAKGLSACHISEALFYGYLKGFYDKLDLDVKSPTINLTLVRDVKRVRRYAVEEEVSVARSCVVCGGPAQVVCTRQDGSRVCLCKVHFVKEKMQLLSWRILDE